MKNGRHDKWPLTGDAAGLASLTLPGGRTDTIWASGSSSAEGRPGGLLHVRTIRGTGDPPRSGGPTRGAGPAPSGAGPAAPPPRPEPVVGPSPEATEPTPAARPQPHLPALRADGGRHGATRPPPRPPGANAPATLGAGACDADCCPTEAAAAAASVS